MDQMNLFRLKVIRRKNRFLFKNVIFTLWIVLISVFGFAFAQEKNPSVVPRSAGKNKTDIDLLRSLCEKSKNIAIRNTKSKQAQNNIALFSEAMRFQAFIDKEKTKPNTRDWERDLQWSPAKKALVAKKFDLKVIEDLLENLKKVDESENIPEVMRLRSVLEKILEESASQNLSAGEKEIAGFFDALPGLVSDYQVSPDMTKTDALAEAIRYAEACHATELSGCLRDLLIKPNFYVHVRTPLLSSLFEREINEPVTVNDDILGTRMRGTGTLTGLTNASFLPNENCAVIRVTMRGEMKTNTVGTNGPVRTFSDNVSNTSTVKDLIIVPSGIDTMRAKTHVSMRSTIRCIETARGGPIVQKIVPRIVSKRKPETEAESKRLTARRINARVDNAVDEGIVGLNEKWKQLPGQSNPKDGMTVSLSAFSTTDRELRFRGIATGKSMPTVGTEVPKVECDADLFMQVHQSSINNTVSCGLGGKSFQEDAVIADLRKQYPKWIEKLLESKSPDESPLNISFAEIPVDVSFTDDKINVKIETSAIERDGREYPGMQILFQFKIENHDGTFQLVAVEPPQVFPLGFNPEKDQMSARETTIRTVMMRRLEKLTEKPIELKETTIEGKNGTLVIKPVHFSTENGWLSIGYMKVKSEK
ncbi:MAG: hypothetical protein FWC50_15405 [Planctomycetaceae bacterium]|nr:hypothetical protein [Planctomycetaceae bacterium]